MRITILFLAMTASISAFAQCEIERQIKLIQVTMQDVHADGTETEITKSYEVWDRPIICIEDADRAHIVDYELEEIMENVTQPILIGPPPMEAMQE